jgi:Uncharacterised BCR, YbaB family COG0718.
MTTPREPVPLTGDLEIDRAIAELTAQAARIEEMTERVAEVRGHGRAANGQVEVEVLPSGALSSLRIESRAMRLGSQALTEAILEAARQAEKDAADQLAALTEPLLEEE